jgi:hypothetical protein
VGLLPPDFISLGVLLRFSATIMRQRATRSGFSVPPDTAVLTAQPGS